MNPPLFTATSRGKFSGAEITCRCAIGKGGVVAAAMKREGDGASPAGRWRLKQLFYRADRIARPETKLRSIPLKPQDGWCDAVGHCLYNRPVTRPFAASHERLWREDGVYDLIVELAHNDAPIVPGLGSAIFFHLAHPDYRPTEGCVAIAQSDMLEVLKRVDSTTHLAITF